MVIPWNQNLRVGLNQLCEVSEKTVRRLQKVKLRVATFPLGQALKELLPVPGHELRSELDDVHVYHCEQGMRDVKLITLGCF